MTAWNDRAREHNQASVCLFVVRYYERYGFGPSIGEIADGVGRSKSTVLIHLRRLRREGLVAFEDGKRRTLRPLVVEVARS